MCDMQSLLCIQRSHRMLTGASMAVQVVVGHPVVLLEVCPGQAEQAVLQGQHSVR